MALSLIFRPLAAWTDPATKHPTPSRFSATWSDTMHRLAYEAEHLMTPAYNNAVVLEVQATERDVRRDGMLRADARVSGRGVVVSFQSIHGPLRYACDRYDHGGRGYLPSWQANVRAIALTLEALRSVDRYGAAARGEQYTGWTQLGAGTPMSAGPLTRHDAAQFIWSLIGTHWTGPGQGPTLMLNDARFCRLVIRSAVKHLHPDRGGDTETFKQVLAARDILVGQ